MDRITLTTPDDWHLHVRDGDALTSVLPFTARQFGRAIIMPNLTPPVTTAEQAAAYRQRIMDALPQDTAFEPLMTLYLTDNTPPDEIVRAKAGGQVFGVKLYPAGATTNSESGVTDIAHCHDTLAAMESDFPLDQPAVEAQRENIAVHVMAIHNLESAAVTALKSAMS